MEIFNGKNHSQLLEQKIIQYVEEQKSGGLVFGELAIVQVGENETSEKYIRLKRALCSKIGINAQRYFLPDTLSDEEIFERAAHIFNDAKVSSVIVQLPLPRPGLNNLLDYIPVKKDVDMLSKEKIEKFYEGDFSFLSPVLRSLEYFIDSLNMPIESFKTCVIGDGPLVGKPAAFYLDKRCAGVELVTNYTPGTYLNYELVVLGVGIPSLAKPIDIKIGAHVVDFGSSVVSGKIKGDLDYSVSLDHLGIVSPSPGGMGPLVVRFLIMNHLGM